MPHVIYFGNCYCQASPATVAASNKQYFFLIPHLQQRHFVYLLYPVGIASIMTKAVIVHKFESTRSRQFLLMLFRISASKHIESIKQKYILSWIRASMTVIRHSIAPRHAIFIKVFQSWDPLSSEAEPLSQRGRLLFCCGWEIQCSPSSNSEYILWSNAPRFRSFSSSSNWNASSVRVARHSSSSSVL